MSQNIVTATPSASLHFTKGDDGQLPKATLEIKNNQQNQNAAYKIKTTAPRLFVVKPIQGIIAPGRTIAVDIQLQVVQMKSIGDVIKHKFMIQATPTELQSSENYKLSQFWEAKGSDKSNIQQLVLKINLLEGVVGNLANRATESDRGTAIQKGAGGIGYEEGGKKQTSYEPAPKDNINENTDDVQKLTKLQNEIQTMQAEIEAIMKKHTEDGNQEKIYEWQTSDDSKPGSTGGQYGNITLLIVFIIFTFLGAFLVRPQ